ncbi:MAG: acetate--CoA ligase family protein [Xanthobacteraceae bacterium]
MEAAGQTDAIGRLFHPKNVVLVGASDRPGHWSKRVWDNLRRFGFPDRVFPVNPNRAEIWGEACFPNLDALPQPPGHLAIFTPAETTVRVLAEGGRVGAQSATVYAAGFGEGADPQGLARGNELRKVIADTGITVVGPVCMGVACGASRFATVPDETLQKLAPSPVAVVVQSGAMCASINRAINDLGLKVAYLASCGSQLGCRVSDFIAYFAEQPELRVILCYVEAVADAAHFLEAARRARENGKLVVAVKIGGSDAARASALAHTGSLAGSAEAFAAFARSAGIVQFSAFEDAIEAVEFLARAPWPRGRNIAVMSNSGALRSLATEAAERTGTTLASLSPATETALRAALDQAEIANPLDTKRTIPAEQYGACLDALIDAPEIDIVLVAEELPIEPGVARRIANLGALSDAARRAAQIGKPVAIFTPLHVGMTEYGHEIRAGLSHVPMLRGTERTLRVVGAISNATCHSLHAGAFYAPPAQDGVAATWRKRAATLAGPTALNEVESKSLLQAYGITLPPERMVTGTKEAVEAAQEIGFPVVLKAVSAALPHKSDAGLVILDVPDTDAVQRAFATLMERASALPAQIDGILVAKYIAGGVETVLGIQRDVEMGPVVMFGLGGILVELFKDVRFAPAFLDRDQARGMVEATRAGRLLEGLRGGKPADVEALYSTLVAIGRLARDLSDVIKVVDVNPFLVCDKGAFALDALVVLTPPSNRGSP